MLRLPAAFLLLAAALPAQTICARGLVEVSGPTICFSAFTHMFRCGNLKLRAGGAINLKTYEGQVVEVCGAVSGLGACRIITVASVTTGVDHLVISGPVSFRIGRGQIATFDLGVTPARFWVMLFSGLNGFTDLGATGVFQLDMRFFFLSQGLLDGTGKSSFPLQVPNDPALVNVWMYFQPAFVDLPTLTPAMGNSDCFQIQ